MNKPAFIPTEKQLTSMEAFRDAVLSHDAFRTQYLDDLNSIFDYDDEEWHKAFTEYHELLLEHDYVAISLVTNGHLVDDIQFIIIAPHTAMNMGLEVKPPRP